jgi:hypothetical protein
VKPGAFFKLWVQLHSQLVQPPALESSAVGCLNNSSSTSAKRAVSTAECAFPVSTFSEIASKATDVYLLSSRTTVLTPPSIAA